MQIQVIENAMNDREEQHCYGKHHGSAEDLFRRLIVDYDLMHDKGRGVQHR